jgi:hypothetical protein
LYRIWSLLAVVVAVETLHTVAVFGMQAAAVQAGY